MNSNGENQTSSRLITGNQASLFFVLLLVALILFFVLNQNSNLFTNLLSKKDKEGDGNQGGGAGSNQPQGTGTSNANANATGENTSSPILVTNTSTNLGFPIRYGVGLRPQPPNAQVKRLQRHLGILVDGRWGNQTQAAVIRAGFPTSFASRAELDRYIGNTLAGAGVGAKVELLTLR